MSSRRKKKRNRQLNEFGQNMPTSHGDGSMESDEFNEQSDYYDTDNDDYDDGDEDFRNDRGASYGGEQEPDAEAEHEPTQAVWGQTEVVSTRTDSDPPRLPKHELPKHDLPGPHIKFPPNAKRKVLTPSTETTAKKPSEADGLPKKPNLLSFWRKKDKEEGVDVPRDKAPTFPAKGKESMKNFPKKSTGTKAEEDTLFAPPKRRWRSKLFVICLVLLALIWALPLIVTKTPLLNIVIKQATGKLDGTAQVQSVSCGWFSGISAEGLDVKDRQGNTVITVPAIEGDRTLFGLLWNSSNLGHFRIEKPTVHVVLGPEGSTNVEKLIAGYLEGPSGDPFDLGIEVVDAQVTLATTSSALLKDEKEARPLATLSGVDASVLMLADPTAAVSTSVKVSGTVDEETVKSKEPAASTKKTDAAKSKNGLTPGQFIAELALGRENRLSLEAQQILFDRFAPLIAQMTSGLELQGSMTGQLDCRWGEVAVEGEKLQGSDDLLVKATAQLDGFSATGGPLGTDRIALAQPKLACQLSSIDGVYILRQVNLDSEVATLALDGQVVIDVNAFTAGDEKNAGTSPAANKNNGVGRSTAANLIAKQTFNLAGRVDLVRLANMLPTTLHLHDQTEVSSGELTLNVSAVKGQNFAPLASGELPIVWDAKIQTSNITAMRRGQQLVWHQPIVMELHAHEADGGSAVVDHLLCTSNFLKIEAEGRREECNAAASCDLSRLMDQLGAFVDLSGLQMRGKGWANLNWRRVDVKNAPLAQAGKPGTKEGFILDGDCHLRDLEISIPQPTVGDLVPIGNPTLASSGSLLKQPWTESRVVMILSAAGQIPADGPISLSKGEVRINSDTEKIIAYLTAPVKEVSEKTVWPLGLSAQGQLGRWVERAHVLGIAADWNAQGVYNAQIGGSYKTDTIKFDSVSVKVNHLHVASPSVTFNEPQLELTLAGDYDLPKSRLLVSKAKCQTSAAVLTAKDLIVGTPGDGPMELAGNLGVEGDLTRMQGWIADPRQPANLTYQGRLTGTADLKQIKGIVTGRVKANVQHLQLSDRAGHRFYEPNLVVTTDGRYDSVSRVVEFTDARLTSSVLTGQAKGKLLSGKDPMGTDLVGSVDCNLQRLSALLVPYLGPGIVVQGRSQSTMKLSGPMALDRAKAKADINWDLAEVYGFNLGRGKIDVTLAEGLATCSPIKMAVNEGKVNVTPQLRVAPGAMQFEMQPGKIVENVRVNQQMCAGGLKYIAPVLADVATVDGRFSLVIDQCRLPIDNPGSGELVGKFMIHSMTVGAGPLLQQLTPLLKRGATSAQLKKESVVTFHMTNGRVHHEGLELVFPDDITIKTRGYVGLDQTLNIEAEMPIPQKWIDQTGGSLKPALRGQKIMIPIAGTLSKPRLNQKQMQKAMQQFIGNAATGVLQKEINQQFNRLLQPR